MKKIIKEPRQWQDQLNAEQYRVTRQGGTEAPFSGKYNEHTGAGHYHCVCCNHPLFGSDSKFHSGCGWPSFFEPLEGAHLTETVDLSHGMKRIEITCSGCGGHLGHVFPDGPKPTGLRYCINSVSIDLEQEKKSDR